MIRSATALFTRCRPAPWATSGAAFARVGLMGSDGASLIGRIFGSGLFLIVLLSTGPALSHDWYTGLKNQKGQDCCAGIHCRQVGACVLQDHREGLMIGDLCMPIPDEALVEQSSPDGNSHACIVGGQLRCAILGSGV